MTHYVIIIKDGEVYRVASGRLKVEKGHTVRFFNFADAPASIVFDKDNPFGDNFELSASGGSHTQTDIQPGYYPYTVRVGKKEATASKPIIIVYP
jgi:hypothetical protein